MPRLAALVKKTDLLLSSDSAPIHVAAAVKTPFIAFFGPTDPARHMPPADKAVVMKENFPCMPCYHTHCDKGYICMRSIKPIKVYNTIKKILEVK